MWQKFKDWINRPFSSDMSAAQWFAFIGLLLAIMAAWRIVLSHLDEV